MRLGAEEYRTSLKWQVLAAVIVMLACLSVNTLLGADSKPVKAPEFSLGDLQGRTVKLSNYRGKAVLLNFWATWCPPCRAEIPDLVAVHQKFKRRGLVVLGIALDNAQTTSGLQRLASFIEKAGITYPVLLGNEAVCRDYDNVYAIPTSFLVDAKGSIVRKYIGLLDRKVLERDIGPFLSR